MHRTRQLAAAFVAVLAAVPASFAGSRPTTTRTDADAAARQALDTVLVGERDGAVTNRTARLRATVNASRQFAPARWQSGFVKVDGEWISVQGSVARLAGNKTLNAYRAQRKKTPNTLAGQLELAAWCRKQKLFAQQQAHLTAALEIDPNHAAARKAMGFVRMGPFWISQRELTRCREEAKQAAHDLKRWVPTVTSIRDSYFSGSRFRQQQALKRLKAIDDAAAIPAIELGLAFESAEAATQVIDYLGEKSHRESTVSLARQGVFSPWEAVRVRAAARLKNRRYDHFVPQVLALTSTPLESKQVLYVDRRGSLFYRHVFGRETVGFKASGLVGYDSRAIPIRTRRTGAGRVPLILARELNRLSGGESANRRMQRAHEVAVNQHVQMEQMKQTAAEWNSRACRLLTAATAKSFGDDATAWWRWWDRYTDSTRYAESESKPEVQLRAYEVVAEPVPMYNTSSCLAAGTPVWTDRGPVAIDKVEIGDRVLAQNVETGELAYKPVLKTTVRPSRPLIAMEIGPRTVHMTGGHPFWVAGKGWMKARDLKEGMSLRDVTGTTAVRPAGPAKAEPTYNLIVADFHTYFVGESKVLSHDVTMSEPTDVLVPGLRRRNAATSR